MTVTRHQLAAPATQTGPSETSAAGAPSSLLAVLEAYPAGGVPLAGGDTASLVTNVRATEADFAAQGVRGEAVALALPNGRDWVVGYLALLAVGASPVLGTPDAPEAEVQRLLSLHGGGRRVVPARADGGRPVLLGTPGSPTQRVAVALIPTSGSTGAAKLVERDESSLLAEGRRYRDGVGLRAEDGVLLPVPLSHAYALGWLYGAWLSGSTVLPAPPTGLNRIAAELAGTGELPGGATVVALVPTLARLLAARGGRRRLAGAPAAPRLRLAMVGAGPVDEDLDAAFRAAFGVGLARNYGSTELGAVFSGSAGLPPMAVGYPLPGVEYELLDQDTRAPADAGPGQLWIRTELDRHVPGPDGDAAGPERRGWHDTGDLAVTMPGGVLRILGRTGRAIRRGGRWVSPLEIESVLRAHPGVRDVQVHRWHTGREGEDGIVARVATVSNGPTGDELRELAGQQLASYKVPDRIHVRRNLRRSATGKVAAPPRFRLTPRSLDVARAYKASELLFALHDLGALGPLAEGADPDELAELLGCDADTLEWLLQIAAGLGLVTPHPDQERVSAEDLTAFVRLEKHLSRTLVTREELVAVARQGTDGRRFDRVPPANLDRLVPSTGADRDAGSGTETGRDGGAGTPAVLTELYAQAMHGPSARSRTTLGLRLLRPARGAHLVEVSAGPGRYLDRLLAADPQATGHLVPLGRLAGDPTPQVAQAILAGRVTVGPRVPHREASVCAVVNGVHGPRPGDDLAELLAVLRPGGRLLIDDVFLPDEAGPGVELGLDWATHGGRAWATAGELIAGLQEAGADITRHLRLGTSPCHLITAGELNG